MAYGKCDEFAHTPTLTCGKPAVTSCDSCRQEYCFEHTFLMAAQTKSTCQSCFDTAEISRGFRLSAEQHEIDMQAGRATVAALAKTLSASEAGRLVLQDRRCLLYVEQRFFMRRVPVYK